MKKELIFRDQIKLSQPRIYKDSQNLVSDIFSNKSSKVGLKIAIRATHSGYLLNSRVYPGVFMEQSVGSWTEGYNKPIILDHDQMDSKKVLGRVHGAKFSRLKDGNDFMFDYKRPGTGTDFGSGFITLDAVINDEDAITKIVDGRYNTVSTGQKPVSARCNICGFDWLNPKDSDMCEHTPGKIYQLDDKELSCFLVTGKLVYKECSIVSSPANVNAQIVAANIDSLKQYYSKDSDEDASFIFNCMDSGAINNIELINTDGEALSLLFKDGKDELPSSAKKFTKTSISLTDGEPMTKKDEKKTTDKADSVLDSWIADAAKKSADSKTEDAKVKDSAKQSVEVQDKTSTKEDKTETKADPLVDELKTENKGLKTQVDSLNAEKDKFKGQIEEKDGLIQTLTSQVTDLRRSQVNEAARTLAIMRGVSGKKEIIQSKDSFDKYVKELSARSIDSLKDSIADSLPELSSAINASVKTLSVTVDKVEDPTLRQSQNDRESTDGKNGKNELKDKNSYLDSI